MGKRASSSFKHRMESSRNWAWKGWESARRRKIMEEVKEKKAKRGRIKKNFKFPLRPALPVRAIWEAASPEEKEKAHQIAAVILEYWMGRLTQDQAAQKLQMPRLRVWQLSRQALSGLAAGLVKQPRPRGKKALLEGLPPEDNPKALNKRIQELERDLGMMKELVGLLRELPGNREELKEAGGSGKKKKVTVPGPESGKAGAEGKPGATG